MLKKISLVFLCIVSLFMVTGCEKQENIEGTLEELMTKVYSNLPSEKTPMGLMNTPLDKENVVYYLGTDDIKFTEGLASESQVGSIAHSVVLVRVSDGTDIEKAKTEIKENVNPNKWICVGVDESEVIVENRGNLIILIMVSDGREELKLGFDNL